MFHPEKIELKLEKEAQRLRDKTHLVTAGGKPIYGPEFKLIRHSVGAVAAANSKLSEAYTVDGKGRVKRVRAFTWEEVRWITNERALCRSDFVYWCTRYGFIISWEGKLTRFEPNIAQLMALSVFADMEAMDIAILVQMLKARQLGVTTLVELIIIWKTMFQARTNALVASSDPDKSATMAKIMELCYENQPHWLVPEITSYHKGELIEFEKQNCGISIQHGTQMSGMARGTTPTTFHLSEVCDYRNPADLIDAALLRAVHDSPWVFGALESTAAGRRNYWHKKWMYNVEFWPKRQSRLCPIFLPWYVGSDIYPTETWLRARPMPINWVPEDMTVAHANRATEYVQSGMNPIVTRYLGSGWSMSREQMWFWEATRREYQAGGILNKFYSEMCSDDKEAFQASNISVFDTEIINTFRESIKMPFGVYGLLAPQNEVPAQFQPTLNDIDPNSPPIDIKCRWHNNQDAHEYRLVPLRHRGDPGLFDPHGKIIMWEPPEHEEIYGLGIDTGFGLGQDRSTIECIRKGSLTRNDAQVLEFVSPYINSFSLWPFALAIGTLYSVKVRGKVQQCKQVIEMAANGENVQHELRKRGWTNFHRWMRYDRKKIQENLATRWGWMTVQWSRSMMLDLLMEALNNGWLDINSGWFVDEMSDLELELEKQKIMAADGAHDDRIMALGIVLFSLHAMDTRDKSGWATRERLNLTETSQFASYKGNESQRNDLAELMNRPERSYTYQVVGSNDPENEFLKYSGAGLWIPGAGEE